MLMGRIYGSWRPDPEQRSKVKGSVCNFHQEVACPPRFTATRKKIGNEGNMLLTSPRIHPSFVFLVALTLPCLSVVHPLSQSTTNSTPSTIADT
ncbi:hypothetical protein BDR04DRAFT_1090148 [Suillus decipiens]|nr:hypothetical protein BDR04DRAFT_1090148 [Suillus decipiens]